MGLIYFLCIHQHRSEPSPNIVDLSTRHVPIAPAGSRGGSMPVEEAIMQHLSQLRKEHASQMQYLMQPSESYQKEALAMLIREANQIADELNLDESKPIISPNIRDVLIDPPRAALVGGAFGNISTSNYCYSVSIGHKFSFLDHVDWREQYRLAREKYYWRKTLMDTNAAYQFAVSVMSAVPIDVTALNRDCDVIMDVAGAKKGGEHFVPLYILFWVPKSSHDQTEAIATIEFCLPSKTLIHLRVNKSDYVLRAPLIVPDVERFLTRTNGTVE